MATPANGANAIPSRSFSPPSGVGRPELAAGPSVSGEVRSGVLHTWANPDGTQRIEDTGPLSKKRMETVDEEFRDAAVHFIKRRHEAKTPFFVWFNATHMHFRTNPKPRASAAPGAGSPNTQRCSTTTTSSAA